MPTSVGPALRSSAYLCGVRDPGLGVQSIPGGVVWSDEHTRAYQVCREKWQMAQQALAASDDIEVAHIVFRALLIEDRVSRRVSGLRPARTRARG